MKPDSFVFHGQYAICCSCAGPIFAEGTLSISGSGAHRVQLSHRTRDGRIFRALDPPFSSAVRYSCGPCSEWEGQRFHGRYAISRAKRSAFMGGTLYAGPALVSELLRLLERHPSSPLRGWACRRRGDHLRIGRLGFSPSVANLITKLLAYSESEDGRKKLRPIVVILANFALMCAVHSPTTLVEDMFGGPARIIQIEGRSGACRR